MAWANTLFAYLNPFNWVGRQTLSTRKRYNLRHTQRHRTHQTSFFHLPVLGAGAGTKRRHESDLPARNTRVRFSPPDDVTPPRPASEDSYTTSDERQAEISDAASLSSEEQDFAPWNSSTESITPSSPSPRIAHHLATSHAYAAFDPYLTTAPAILTNLSPTCPPATKSNPQAPTIWANLTRAAETTQGWPTPDAELYVHLALRGNEPLMPLKWSVDFPTLPGRLFVPQPADPGYTPGAPLPVLNSLGWDQKGGKEARVCRVLAELVGTGSYVRDLMRTSSHPRTRAQSRGQTSAETAQRRAVVAAVEWAIRDAGVAPETNDSHLPCLLVMQSEGETTAVLRERCVRELRELREAWRGFAALRNGGRSGSAPRVYAVLCRGSKMAFVGLRDEGDEEVDEVDVDEEGGNTTATTRRTAQWVARVEDHDQEQDQDSMDTSEELEAEAQLAGEIDDIDDRATPVSSTPPSTSEAAPDGQPAPAPASTQQNPLRILDMYDWSKEEGQDVWIAVSVMLLAVHARDLMVKWYGLRDPDGVPSDDEVLSDVEDDEREDDGDGDDDEEAGDEGVDAGGDNDGESGDNRPWFYESIIGDSNPAFWMSGALAPARPEGEEEKEGKEEGKEEEGEEE